MKTAHLTLVPTEDVTTDALGAQRWREGRYRHRPAGEPFAPGRHAVEPLDRGEAAPFVQRHHYAGSYPAARVAYGLHRCAGPYRPGLLFGAALVGVVVFARGQQDAAAERYAPGVDPAHVVELARLVLLDEVEGNAESWAVARAFRLLRADLPEVRLVLSSSDPVVRRAVDGTPRLRGHVGQVYQGLGAIYHGRSKARRQVLTPSGEVIPERAWEKLRAGDRGAEGLYQRLLAWGAPPIRQGEDGRAYADRALVEGPWRVVRHPGCHVYSWRLDRRQAADASVYPRRIAA